MSWDCTVIGLKVEYPWIIHFSLILYSKIHIDIVRVKDVDYVVLEMVHVWTWLLRTPSYFQKNWNAVLRPDHLLYRDPQMLLSKFKRRPKPVFRKYFSCNPGCQQTVWHSNGRFDNLSNFRNLRGGLSPSMDVLEQSFGFLCWPVRKGTIYRFKILPEVCG